MAIKDQCNQCAHYRQGSCDVSSTSPTYDQTSCEAYKKTGIDLSKYEDVSDVQEATQTEPSNNSMERQKMFSHPFSFSGRIRRLEYGLSYIIYNIWYSVFSVCIEIGNETIGILYLITFVPAVWFILAQGTKRCHDRDNSGWYQIIPFYGLWMLFADGDAYENSYGTDPKGRNICA